MTNEQMKSHIRENHEKHRYEQYLVLYAQQCAIDCLKTGVDTPKHIKSVIRKLSELLIYNVVKINDRKKVFMKGNLNNGPKVVTLGNKQYTVEYEPIKIGELESKVVVHSLELLKKRQLQQGILLEMKATYGVDFELHKEYILKRKDSNRFLFQVIDQDGILLDQVRLSKGSKEFNEEIDESNVIVDSHKAISKTMKYDTWYVKRCV